MELLKSGRYVTISRPKCKSETRHAHFPWRPDRPLLGRPGTTMRSLLLYLRIGCDGERAPAIERHELSAPMTTPGTVVRRHASSQPGTDVLMTSDESNHGTQNGKNRTVHRRRQS